MKTKSLFHKKAEAKIKLFLSPSSHPQSHQRLLFHRPFFTYLLRYSHAPPLISKKPVGLDPHFLQAIKEDKKRGVLSEGEYRRSYRKTSQLNDMRFGGGLSADAR